MSRRLRRSSRHRTSPVVLTNVLSLDGNPYLDLWSDAVRRSGAQLRELTWAAVTDRDAVEWVHLQWPERALRPAARRRAALGGADLLARTATARLRGARVLLTAHNIASHDPRHPGLDRWLWRLLAFLVTDLQVLTAAGAESFLQAHPRMRRSTRHAIPHGDYTPVAEPIPRPVARAAAGLPATGRVFLTFGALRGYKGVLPLLQSFRDGTRPDDVLVIAGRVLDPGLGVQLSAAAREDPRIVLRTHFLAQEELNTLVSSASWVVLPYRKVLNSGSVLLSLTLHRPVLVPDTPTFTEIAGRSGPAWVQPYQGELSGSVFQTLPDPPAGAPDLNWCTWTTIEKVLAALWSSQRRDNP